MIENFTKIDDDFIAKLPAVYKFNYLTEEFQYYPAGKYPHPWLKWVDGDNNLRKLIYEPNKNEWSDDKHFVQETAFKYFNKQIAEIEEKKRKVLSGAKLY